MNNSKLNTNSVISEDDTMRQKKNTKSSFAGNRIFGDLYQAIPWVGLALIIFGLSYLSVPLYRLYCQLTGYGGTIQVAPGNRPNLILDNTKKTETREVTVRFNGDIVDTPTCKLVPQNPNEIKAIIGEPTLTFYSLTNLSDKPLIGIATYNVTPAKAAIYFNKIQCFCLSAIVA